MKKTGEMVSLKRFNPGNLFKLVIGQNICKWQGKNYMVAIHKNDLSSYLSDWKMKMEMMNKFSKIVKNKSQLIPKTFQAIFIQTTDLWIVLRYLDSKLRILENNKLPFSEKYQDYADAIVFLKVTCMFYRILLDTLAGIIEYFYKKNEKINLPYSFHKLLIKSKKWGKFPKDLSVILKKAHIWFPEVKKRRDDLVHHYESFLILIEENKSRMNILKYSNILYENKFKNFGGICEYIGFLLCVYQQLIDDLLDHFDTKFKDWYGIIAGRSSRTQTCREGDMLWLQNMVTTSILI